MELTREQISITLTLMGWEPMSTLDIDGSPGLTTILINPSRGLRCMSYGAVEQDPNAGVMHMREVRDWPGIPLPVLQVLYRSVMERHRGP